MPRPPGSYSHPPTSTCAPRAARLAVGAGWAPPSPEAPVELERGRLIPTALSDDGFGKRTEDACAAFSQFAPCTVVEPVVAAPPTRTSSFAALQAAMGG